MTSVGQYLTAFDQYLTNVFAPEQAREEATRRPPSAAAAAAENYFGNESGGGGGAVLGPAALYAALQACGRMGRPAAAPEAGPFRPLCQVYARTSF